MQANDFWCRAFLAAMTGAYGMTRWRADGAADYCEQAADAALEVARRRGMIAGALPGDAVPADPPRPAPTLERVEFTAEPSGEHGSGVWLLKTARWPRGIILLDGDECVDIADGTRIRIKWGESMPPRPIEVWIERPKGGV